jgi:hypothetical protein
MQVSTEETIEFAPHVTATCKGNAMSIKIQFTSPYTGAVHARDYRNPNCMAFGNGSTALQMSLNLQVKIGTIILFFFQYNNIP